MSRGKSDKIVYKEYNQSQQWLLPPRLDELIPLSGKKLLKKMLQNLMKT